MYRYDEFDQDFVNERVAQFRDQVERRLSGELTEDQFKPLRLMNGVYLQLHAYMLRIAIPYGTLEPGARCACSPIIARKYDRGYGHFTTRQNLQFNWPALKDIPDILGRSRRGRDARHPDLGQLHPQRHRRSFRRRRRRRDRRSAALCRDPAAVVVAPSGIHLPAAQVQDRGDRRRRATAPRSRSTTSACTLKRDANGRARLRRLCRRRPRPHADDRPQDPRLPARGGPALLHRGDPARLQSRSAAATTSTRRASRSSSTRPAPRRSRRQVEEEWERIRARRAGAARGGDPPHRRPISRRRRLPPRPATSVGARSARAPATRRSTPGSTRTPSPHRVTGHAHRHDLAEADRRHAGRRDRRPDGADRRSRRALQPRRGARQPRAEPRSCRMSRSTTCRRSTRRSRGDGLATANAGLVTDIIACPGLDYCALANARSIPIAQRISERFADRDRQTEIGELKIKISGCINACGHHHVGHIGILGVEKKGEEFYQITLGGSGDETASVGEIIGPGFSVRRGRRRGRDASSTPISRLRSGPDETFPRRLSPARPGAVQGGALWRRLTRSRIAVEPEAGTPRRGRGAERALRRSATRAASIALAVDELFPGRIALVSSFGAESAVLLHMLSRDRPRPCRCIFLDTGRLFPETLDYRDAARRAPRPDRRAHRRARRRAPGRAATRTARCG